MRLCIVSISFVVALATMIALSACAQAEKVEVTHYHEAPRIDYIEFEVEVEGQWKTQYRQDYHYHGDDPDPMEEDDGN